MELAIVGLVVLHLATGALGAMAFTGSNHLELKITPPPDPKPVQPAVDDYAGSVASAVYRGVRTGVSGALKVPYVAVAVAYVARHASKAVAEVHRIRKHTRRGGFHKAEIERRLEVFADMTRSVRAGRHSWEARQMAAALLMS